MQRNTSLIGAILIGLAHSAKVEASASIQEHKHDELA